MLDVRAGGARRLQRPADRRQRRPARGPVHVWATKAPRAPEQVVLINLDAVGHTVLVRVPGPQVATLDRLSAPNVAATGHVTLGGQSVARESRTGLLKGRRG